MADLSHFDEKGASRMVDTSGKPETLREARAAGSVRMTESTLSLIRNRAMAKGDVLEVARLAGIMAAKRTSELIPLCHPLSLTSVGVEFSFLDESVLRIDVTVYDMCKSVDRGMTIEFVRLEEKSGGKSGHFKRDD
jgi:cyclic pyranopterin phosphate synthase